MGKILAYSRDNTFTSIGLLEVISSKIDQPVLRKSDVLFNNINVTQDLIVNGNFTVKGLSTIIDTVSTIIQDNLLLLNSSETGSGVQRRFAGIEIDRGTQANAYLTWDESTQNFKTGYTNNPGSSDLQVVATREDNPLSNGVMVYDLINNRLDSQNHIDIDMQFTSNTNSTNVSTGSVTLAGGLGVKKNIYTGGSVNLEGGTSTYQTISSDQNNNMMLNATGIIKLNSSKVSIPQTVPLTFSTTEKIVADQSNNLTITANQNINLIPGGNVNIPDDKLFVLGVANMYSHLGTLFVNPVDAMVLPSQILLCFGSTATAMSNTGSDLNVISNNDIYLTATGNVILPTTTPLYFGNSQVSIKYDLQNTTLKLTSTNNIYLNSTTTTINKNTPLYFGSTGESIATDNSNNLTISANSKINFKSSSVDIPSNTPFNLGLTQINTDTPGNTNVISQGNLNLNVPSGMNVNIPQMVYLYLGGNTVITNSQNDLLVTSANNTKFSNPSGNVFLDSSLNFVDTTVQINRTSSSGLNINAVAINLNGNTAIPYTTDSINNSSGALVVSGGAGIAKNVNIGGDLTVNQTVTTGQIVLTGSNGVAFMSNTDTSGIYNMVRNNRTISINVADYNSYGLTGSLPTFTVTDNAGPMLTINNTQFLVSPKLTVSNSDDSTNVSTGSVVAAGGMGIAKNLYVGGNLNVAKDVSLSNTTITGNLTVSSTNISLSSTGNTTISSTSGDILTQSVNNIVTSTSSTIHNAPTFNVNSTNVNLSASGNLNISAGGIQTTTGAGGITSSSSGSMIYNANGKISFDTTDAVNGVQFATNSPGIPLILGNAYSNVTVVSDNLIVQGNLTVAGTTTTIDSTNLIIENNTIVTNAGPGGGTSDGGLLVTRYQPANDTSVGTVIKDIPDASSSFQTPNVINSVDFKLNSSASSVDNYYEGYWMLVTSGLGNNQVRRIKSYNGSTKIGKIYSTGDTPQGLNWTVQPTAGDNYSLYSGTYAGMFYQESTDEIVFGTVPYQSGSGILVPHKYYDIHCNNILIEGTFSTSGNTGINGQLIVDYTDGKAFVVRKLNDSGDVFYVDTTNNQIVFENPQFTVNSVIPLMFNFKNITGNVLPYANISVNLLNNSTGAETGSINLNTKYNGIDYLTASFNVNSSTIYSPVAFTNTNPSTSSISGAVLISGGLSVQSTNDSASIANGGSVTISGGLAVSKTAYINSLRVSSTMDSSNTSTGSLIVQGGLAVSKNIALSNYLVSPVAGHLLFTPNAGSANGLSLASAGNYDNLINVYGSGNERLNIGYNYSGSKYQIHSGYDTSGTVRPLSISTGSNSNQVLLNSDGSVLFSGTVTNSQTFNVLGSSFFTGPVQIMNTTVSSSASSGSMVVSGGVAINSNLVMGSGSNNLFNVNSSSNLLQFSTLTPGNNVSYEFFGNSGFSTQLNIYGTSGVNYERLNISGSTGFSINTVSSGSGLIKPLSLYTGTNTGQLVLGTDGNVSSVGNWSLSSVSIVSTTNSVSASTGALTIAGGLGIAKNMNIAGTLISANTVDATSSASASVVLNGGLAVNKSILVSGDYLVNTNSTVLQLSSVNPAGNVSFYSGSNNNTNTNVLNIYGVGGSNSEYLSTGYNSNSGGYYQISTKYTGTGVSKPLQISATGNGSTQVTLNTDGTVQFTSTTNSVSSASGSVLVSGSIAVNSTQDSVNSTNGGTFTTSGGLSVGKTLCVGKQLNLDFNQSYVFSGNTNGYLQLQSGTSGTASGLKMYTKAGSGTDNCLMDIYSLGTPLQTTNTSFVRFGFEASSNTCIAKTISTGTGSANSIVLQSGNNLNQLVLGTDGSLSSSGQVYFQNTNDATSTTTGAAIISGGASVYKNLWVGESITSTSDARLKDIVYDFENDKNILDKISKLRAVKYKLKKSETQETVLGFLAQDFIEYFPELVSKAQDNGYLALMYDRIPVVLLQCIKELKKEIDMLKAKN